MLAELRALETALPGFRFIPALSEQVPPGESWAGETGLITDVVRRSAGNGTAAGNLARSHAYVCGPPPMVAAAVPLLAQLGVPGKDVYFAKFVAPSHTLR